MASLAAAAKPAIKTEPVLHCWCPVILSDVKVPMCSLKMLVVMSITTQLYRSLVILCYCRSNIWNPKFKVCLWITGDSCQNWQLKCHNFICCASAHSRCQGWRKPCSRAGQARAPGIRGSPEGIPLSLRGPVSWALTNRERAGFSALLWEVTHKPLTVSRTEKENNWPGSSPERVEENKRQLLFIAPNAARTDFRETRTLPRVKATLHFIGISSIFWEVRRSSSEPKMNCCSSWAVTSADAGGYESVKIDSWSLGTILVTRQNGNGRKYRFSQV